MSNTLTRYYDFTGQPKPNGVNITAIDLPRKNANTKDTSVPLAGKDYYNYSPPVVESLVWALGNFAGDAPPLNALHGQTWFDTKDNTLRLYVGDDHGVDLSDWVYIKETELSSLPSIVPKYDNLYDLGSNSQRWDKLFCESLYSTSGVNLQGVSVSSLLPTDTGSVLNDSTVPGRSVKDAIVYLNGAEIKAGVTNIINITPYPSVAVSIVPENARYRIHTDVDIEVSIQTITQPVNNFQIFRIGVGRLKIISGGGNILTNIKGGDYCSFANFTSQSSDSWLVHGNFG